MGCLESVGCKFGDFVGFGIWLFGVFFLFGFVCLFGGFCWVCLFWLEFSLGILCLVRVFLLRGQGQGEEFC